MFHKMLFGILWVYGLLAPFCAILGTLLILATWLESLRDNARYHAFVMIFCFFTAGAYLTLHELRTRYNKQWAMPPIVLSYIWVFTGAFSILHLIRILNK